MSARKSKLYLGWAEKFASSRGASSLGNGRSEKWRFVLEALRKRRKRRWRTSWTGKSKESDFESLSGAPLSVAQSRQLPRGGGTPKKVEISALPVGDLLYHSLDEEERGSARRLANAGVGKNNHGQGNWSPCVFLPRTRGRAGGELIGEISKTPPAVEKEWFTSGLKF